MNDVDVDDDDTDTHLNDSTTAIQLKCHVDDDTDMGIRIDCRPGRALLDSATNQRLLQLSTTRITTTTMAIMMMIHLHYTLCATKWLKSI